jgi:hypothetical protein
MHVGPMGIPIALRYQKRNGRPGGVLPYHRQDERPFALFSLALEIFQAIPTVMVP